MRPAMLHAGSIATLAVGLCLIANASSFADPSPTESQSNVTRFFDDASAGKRLKVAYLGGSITWGACATDPLKTSYRALVSANLEQQFPDARFKFIDAAIGGQPSKLAVFRMDRDVIPYEPDLVFVEFAVNDFDTPDSQETMEGIVRKLHKSCPNSAVVILIIGSNWDYHTPAQPKHIELAKYYGVPAIDICSAVQEKIKAGLNTHDILFDGCHPNDAGYKIYADIIVKNLEKLREQKSPAIAFPEKPLTANRYESAAMLELSKQKNLGDWKIDQPAVVGTWFDQQPSRWQSSAISASSDHAKLELDLQCSAIGVYFESTEGAGTLRIEADDKQVLDVPTTMTFPNARVNFAVKTLDQSVLRRIRLSLESAGKGAKVSYLLYCR